MAINYIPGPESLLAPAAREITEGLQKFINPNRDFQIQMQRTLATNPELMMQLADVEKETPGTLERIGMGKIGQIVASLPGTVEGEVTRGNRGELVRGKEIEIKNLTMKNEEVMKAARKWAELVAQNSDLSVDQALAYGLGQTSAQRRTQVAGATTAEAEAEVAPDIASARKAQARLTMTTSDVSRESMESAIVDLPDLGTLNLRDEARNFLDGKLDAGRSSTFFTHPQTRDAFITSIDAITRERAQSFQQTLAAQRTTTDRALDRQELQQAFTMYKNSGGVGTLDLWRKFLNDSTTQARAMEIMDDPSKAKPEERELAAIARYTSQEIELDNLRSLTTLRKEINTQFQVLVEAPKEARGSNIDLMNQLLAKRAAMGGPKLNVRYNSGSPLWPGGRFEFTDESGNVYNQDEAQAIISDPASGVPQLTPDIKPIVERIIEADAGADAALTAYKAQEKDEERRRRVESYLRAKRLVK